MLRTDLFSRSTAQIVLGLALCLLPLGASAQQQRDRNWDGQQQRDRNGDGQRVTRLDPGMTIRIRTTQPIQVGRADNRIFHGIVDQDVRGVDGRMAIPQGSPVELIVRRVRNNELVLDLESVAINGQRYEIDSDAKRIVGTSGNDSLVGAIVGSIRGAEVRGRRVRIPRDSVMNFRLDRGMIVAVSNRRDRRR